MASWQLVSRELLGMWWAGLNLVVEGWKPFRSSSVHAKVRAADNASVARVRVMSTGSSSWDAGLTDTIAACIINTKLVIYLAYNVYYCIGRCLQTWFVWGKPMLFAVATWKGHDLCEPRRRGGSQKTFASIAVYLLFYTPVVIFLLILLWPVASHRDKKGNCGCFTHPRRLVSKISTAV